MIYHSTRNKALTVSSAEAIAQGIATDAGLDSGADSSRFQLSEGLAVCRARSASVQALPDGFHR